MEDNSGKQSQKFLKKLNTKQDNSNTNLNEPAINNKKRVSILQSKNKQSTSNKKSLKNKENKLSPSPYKYPQKKKQIKPKPNKENCIENTQYFINKDRSNSNGFKTSSVSIQSKIDYCINDQLNQQNICLIHEKPLEVICISDTSIICTNCAIYGCHKGHEFKSKKQVKQDKLTRCQKLLELIEKKKQTEDKLLNKENRQKIDKKLNKKKQTMLLQMSEKFQKIRVLMNQTEKRCIQKIQKEINQQIKLLDSILKNENKYIQYIQWQKQVENQLYCLNGEQNLQQQLKYLDYKKMNAEKDLIKKGQNIILEIQQKYKIALTTVEDFTISIQLVFDLNQIESKLNWIENTFLKDKRKKSILKNSFFDPNFSGLMKRIDDQQLFSNDQLLLDSLKNTSKLLDQSDLQLSLDNLNQFEQHNILYSPKVSMNKKNNSIIRNSSTSSINSSKLFAKKNKIFLPEKYEKILTSFIHTDTDVVDFSQGQLGDEIILKVLQQLRGKNIKNLKIIRNKLTDNIIQRLWPLIANVTMLNLAQNNFTQKIIDSVLLHIKQLPNLKNITLTQNKIRDRNVKCRLQQIRKCGINILV